MSAADGVIALYSRFALPGISITKCNLIEREWLNRFLAEGSGGSEPLAHHLIGHGRALSI